ncbi:hypothetical protein EMPS_03463 [Entomortierella parvispora]|uniref:Uncharacterized protein n=1 Tax=Entomortierella parvispora TaxID=205924 RepID=A0A9P3H7A6_9FUNG|nr:hypothetical protein EMPS_03463 [Entomortierella parvispora]
MTIFSLKPGPRPETIDIGDGLRMRWSTKADADNVGALLGVAFKWEALGFPLPQGDYPPPNDMLTWSGKRLLRGNSAVMTEYDFALVENTRAADGENPIVACACLHAVPGYYGSVPIQFGKPEVFGTHPDYRNRGLIRRLLLEMIHPASDERGDLIQFIYGIPYFYLQFGYSYALRTGPKRTKIPSIDHIPKAHPSIPEPFRLRAVTLDDIPYLVRMSTSDKLNRPGTEVGLLFDEAYWKYTTHDAYKAKETIWDASRLTQIIVDVKTGKDVGVVVSNFMGLWQWELFVLEDHVPYREATYPVVRAMVKMAKDRYDDPTGVDDSMIDHLINGLGPYHPASIILAPILQEDINDRIYTRMANYPGFITKVAPVLEERLSKSALAGITASLRLDFFRKVEGASARGLEIVFKDGKIVSANDWMPPTAEELMLQERERMDNGTNDLPRPLVYGANFPPLSFTRLVTGDVTVDQLLEQHGKSWFNDSESCLLLNILFPKVDHYMISQWW